MVFDPGQPLTMRQPVLRLDQQVSAPDGVLGCRLRGEPDSIMLGSDIGRESIESYFIRRHRIVSPIEWCRQRASRHLP